MGLAVICPGQGGQHREMFVRLREHGEAARAIDEVSRELGFDVVDVPDDAPLHRNRVAQPLLCAHSIATWAVLEPLLGETEPMLFLGYSVGEVGAHVLAGSIPERDALALCAGRASAMDAAVDAEQSMAALRGLSRSQVDALCARHAVDIAIVNGASHYVVGGEIASLEALCRDAEAETGAHVRRLKVSVASHTRLLASATSAFAALLAEREIHAPRTPVLAGIDASPVRRSDAVRSTLAMQLSTPLQWERCLLAARELGATCLLELGPGSAMTQMAREVLPDTPARSLQDFRTFDGAAGWARRNAENPA